jgi:hypothetical protein
MEITYSGRATVQKTLSHRPDAALKQERFLSEIFGKICLTVVRPNGPCPLFLTAPAYITTVAHSVPQPINRGPWALRTARIRY